MPDLNERVNGNENTRHTGLDLNSGAGAPRTPNEPTGFADEPDAPVSEPNFFESEPTPRVAAPMTTKDSRTTDLGAGRARTVRFADQLTEDPPEESTPMHDVVTPLGSTHRRYPTTSMPPRTRLSHREEVLQGITTDLYDKMRRMDSKVNASYREMQDHLRNNNETTKAILMAQRQMQSFMQQIALEVKNVHADATDDAKERSAQLDMDEAQAAAVEVLHQQQPSPEDYLRQQNMELLQCVKELLAKDVKTNNLITDGHHTATSCVGARTMEEAQ